MLSRQDCKDELWIELSLLKKSQLQASQPLCLLSCGHVFGVSFFFFCGGFHSLPPTMWIMSSTDSSQWSDPPVNQWNLTTMSRSGPSCWDWPALLHTPLPPTHRHSHCLKLHKIQGGGKRQNTWLSFYMISQNWTLGSHIWQREMGKWIKSDWLGLFREKNLHSAYTYAGGQSRHSLLDRLISSLACFEVSVLVMWLTRGSAMNVWPQHDQKVLWSLFKHLTIPAMPSCKTANPYPLYHIISVHLKMS